MTILETVEEIFSDIALPQNLARKVALVKSQIAALEQKNIKLEGKVIKLAAELKESESKNEKLKAEHQRVMADLLHPEQGISQPMPGVITKRNRGY